MNPAINLEKIVSDLFTRRIPIHFEFANLRNYDSIG